MEVVSSIERSGRVLPSRLVAVVISFNPEMESFAHLLRQLSEQVDTVVVVDNASSCDITQCLAGAAGTQAQLITAEDNLGIAAAQNLGITKAFELGCSEIVFFDQDSKVPAGLIGRLKAHLSDPSVAIVAPVHFDSVQGFGYPVVDIQPNGTRRKWRPEAMDRPVDVSVVISSGTLVRRYVFDQVGLMDESLFIDYVDTEWCLRCAQKGYFVRVEPAARLEHSLGLGSMRLGKLRIPVHRPERRYYRIRNAILLLRYKHVPLLMALREVCFGLIHSLLILAASEQRADYLRYYWRGVVDGLRGRTGACPAQSTP